MDKKAKEATKYQHVNSDSSEQKSSEGYCQTENKGMVAKAVEGREERKVVLENTKENWGNEESRKKHYLR